LQLLHLLLLLLQRLLHLLHALHLFLAARNTGGSVCNQKPTHNTLPRAHNAPRLVAWRKSIDNLPRQTNAALGAMLPLSCWRRV
jgi:hypothetical protein